MLFFKNLFKKDKDIPSKIKNDFSIEFYPLTNRYYPKYKEYYYLKKDYNTGIMEKREPYLFTYADYGKTQQEAEELITLFKEQQLKENVKTIQL